MNRKFVTGAFCVVLTGCITPPPPVTNLSGAPIKFSEPILAKSDRATAKYVLLEKSVADGKYKLLSMSAIRQPITNERQERIAFNADLSAFAPDFSEAYFQTYVDAANYGQQTVIAKCSAGALKTEQYSPCNSAFGAVFIPTGITKAYVAGSMSASAMNNWKEPSRNMMRYVESPMYALFESGVFQRLPELAAAK